jgi:hypothetical protein
MAFKFEDRPEPESRRALPSAERSALNYTAVAAKEETSTSSSDFQRRATLYLADARAVCGASQHAALALAAHFSRPILPQIGGAL